MIADPPVRADGGGISDEDAKVITDAARAAWDAGAARAAWDAGAAGDARAAGAAFVTASADKLVDLLETA